MDYLSLFTGVIGEDRPRDPRALNRTVAVARILLGTVGLFAIYIDPTEPIKYAHLAYLLLAAYVIASIALAVVYFRGEPKRVRLGALGEAMDLTWAAAISLFTAGPNSPFFMFFVFALVAATLWRGLAGAFYAAFVGTTVLAIEAFLLKFGVGLSVLEGTYDLNMLIMRATYLIIFGLVIGLLGESEKQTRAKWAFRSSIARTINAQTAVFPAVQLVGISLLEKFAAKRVLIFSEHVSTGRCYVWDSVRPESRFREMEERCGKVLMVPVPEQGRVIRTDAPIFNRRRTSSALGKEEHFRKMYPFRTALATAFSIGSDWAGRVLVLDPLFTFFRANQMGLLNDVVQQTVTAIHNIYLLQTIGREAGAIERARVSRELHDGSIQGLIGLEMQIDVLKRCASGPLRSDLEHAQGVLRSEVRNLRDLMEQLRPIDVGAGELVSSINDLVDKFSRETGIAGRFSAEVGDISLSSRVCQELMRIVKEALANVRRHSGATVVAVRLAASQGGYQLLIDDNGKGFEFSGRLTLAELDAVHRGPIAIKQRVRSIRGDLRIDSLPGQGASLTIFIPDPSKVKNGNRVDAYRDR